jgi:hypothetical protein
MGADEAAKSGRTRRQQDPATGSPLSGGRGSGRQRTLDRDIQAQIGQQLRAIYDDVLTQEVPDRFTKLLAELDARISEAAPAAEKPDKSGQER